MVLFRELKRRKVLHTLSLYVVGCWVALQVVEVLSDAGLPAGTMRRFLWAMTAGFPIVLVTAWFYDISASGITRTPQATPSTELPEVNLGDHAILLGLMAVVTFTAYVLSLPVQPAVDPQARQRVLVVMPFEDINAADSSGRIGDAFADELREELTRIAGLKVFGRETSLAIRSAGDNYNNVAVDLGVTSILMGDVELHDGNLEVTTRLISLPASNVVWRDQQQRNVRDGAKLQRGIVQAVIDTILPAASAQTTHAPRIEAEECAAGFELYLRGRQLRESSNWDRGIELLEEAVRLAPNCAVAWDALARASLLTWSKVDFAKAGAAARRALELNESLPASWAILAEIAEEEKRWNEAEELYLRALYVDPTSASANVFYAEALLARGRAREALHYALEAYRYEPAWQVAVWKVTLVSRYLGDADTVIKYANIYRDLRVGREYNGWDELGEGYRLKGDAETALSYWGEHPEYFPDWYPQCVRASIDPAQAEGLPAKVRESLRQHLEEDPGSWSHMFEGWQIIRCATWIGEPDIAIDVIEQTEGIPAEAQYLLFAQADSGILRRTDHFRRKVVEEGLLDYWRTWGWSDYCQPDGDSFVCD
jgi:TolB-like protein/tetratricopeptide (TPR) repeat protein